VTCASLDDSTPQAGPKHRATMGIARTGCGVCKTTKAGGHIATLVGCTGVRDLLNSFCKLVFVVYVLPRTRADLNLPALLLTLLVRFS
jgi:hypothetical protein